MKVVAICPFYDTIRPETEAGLRAVESMGIHVDRPQSSSIARMRSERASYWTAHGAERLLYIDADMGFTPDDVKRLLAHDLPFVVAPYFQRRCGGEAVFRPLDEAAPIIIGKGGGLIELRYSGFGFNAVKTEVFHRIAQTVPMLQEGYPPFFQEMLLEEKGGVSWLSEDTSFCRRARDVGVTIHCDTSIRIFHLGIYPYSGEDMAGPKRVQESLTIEGAPPP